MTWVVVTDLLDFVILVAIWFNCAIIGEPSGSSAFVRHTHFIWVAKMVDQTSGYAIVCCTYSGNVRSCTWRVNMAAEVSGQDTRFSFGFAVKCSAASTLTDWKRNQTMKWSPNSFISKLSGLYKTAWPTGTLWNLNKSQNTQWHADGMTALQAQASMTWSGHQNSQSSGHRHYVYPCQRFSSENTLEDYDP
jgi:hypothetical protein